MKGLLSSKIFAVVLIVFVLWLGLSLVSSGIKKESTITQVNNLQTKIDSAERDNKYLSKFSDYFQTPAFLEKQARSKLNYKAQGEEVTFVYKDTSEKKELTSGIDSEEILKIMPNYKKWWYYVLGY